MTKAYIGKTVLVLEYYLSYMWDVRSKNRMKKFTKLTVKLLTGPHYRKLKKKKALWTLFL